MEDKNILDLKVVLEGCINDTIWREYGVEAKLSDVYYCDKHSDQVSMDLGDWVFVAIITILLTLNIVGSLYDVCRSKDKEETGNQYLLSFSIFRNWRQLTSLHVEPKFDRLKGINGLKSLGTFLVGVAHVMWLITTGFTDNPRDFEMAHGRLHYQLIFNGMVIVQTFFILSGYLLVFQLQEISGNKTLSWNMVPKILFMRWIRLTPANSFMVFFTATWLRHLESGPLWNLCVGSISNQCRSNWWQNILYINNYFKTYCAAHTWHLSADMQLFTVGLVVYMATASRHRHLALALLGLVGMIAPALHVWLQDLDALVIFRPEFYRVFDSETFWSLYIPGHNNLASYAIGMAIGHVSYYCVKNNIEYPNNKMLKLLVWCTPIAIIGLILSGTVFYVDGERPRVYVRMVYAAIQRPAFGVLIALIILNLVLKFEDCIRGFLEWRMWIFTNRLSYSVYLLHLNIIYILLGLRTQLSHVSFFYVIINHLGVFSFTLLLSIPFYLLLESPLRALTKAIFEETSPATEKKIK